MQFDTSYKEDIFYKITKNEKRRFLISRIQRLLALGTDTGPDRHRPTSGWEKSGVVGLA